MNKEEAIEVVKKNWPDSRYTLLREALETLIPELTESEDNKIRKEIISALKFANDGGVYDKHISYLEKQKEQKPQLYWHKIKAYEKLPCRAYIYKFAYEQENNFYGKATIHGCLIPNEPVTIGCDTWYLPVEDIKNLPKEDELDTMSSTKTDEQKLAWSEEEMKLLDLIINDYEKASKSFCGYDGKIGLLKAIRNGEYNLSKPAEWSDTNELVFKDICKHLKEEGYNGWVILLEALRSGEFKQPVAEWNEGWREEDIQTRFAFYTYKDDPSVLYLSNVFVEETSRNHGFGTRILRAAEKVAEIIGATTISLKVKHDSPANAWYRKNGYGYVAFEGEYDWLEKNLEYMKPKQEVPADTEVLTAKLVNLLKSYRIGEATATGLANRIADTYGTQRYLDGLCDGKKSEWKPSEEQMKALYKVAYNIVGTGTETDVYLVQLYEQLKKLI